MSGPAQMSDVPGIPPWLPIAATLLSGGLAVYIARQLWERRKLRTALKAEIQSMNGLETCSAALQSRTRSPSNEPLKPSEVPPSGTIPTMIYESNINRLGLLKSDELADIVEFYSQVLHHKAIIDAIRQDENVPEPDQEDLYDSVTTLEVHRQQLFSDGWMDEDDDQMIETKTPDHEQDDASTDTISEKT